MFQQEVMKIALRRLEPGVMTQSVQQTQGVIGAIRMNSTVILIPVMKILCETLEFML